MEAKQQHWEKVYTTKQPNEVSWTQAIPGISLQLVHFPQPALADAIIDIGGGDSLLAGHLLAEGFTNITVLDISAAALQRARTKLGNRQSEVEWITADILAFTPYKQYHTWHDRAAFHFLTAAEEIEHYVRLAYNSLLPGGYAIVGTFAQNGPEKCSGLHVTRYTAEGLAAVFSPLFTCVHSEQHLHTTPFGTQQPFTFCVLQKI